jgi:predicted TIM-barrel fold metal-dependent hydrolase
VDGEARVIPGKIALEEHFVPVQLEELITNPGWGPELWRATLDQLADVDERLAEMERLGIERMVLSLGSNGIQDVVDPVRAAALATEANDALAGVVRAHPGRFSGFAALPLQDPAAAAAELDRAVTELGMVGALANGYSSVGDLDTGAYYDEPAYEVFWERVEALGVPFYLHPRNPLPNQRRIYEGRPELLGPTWAFAVETGTHALRLLVSGLFDRFPGVQIVLGHLGEFLPFAIRRLEARMERLPSSPIERPASEYLRENFWITTSGNYHAPSLLGVLLELGADRLLFAADYPFEVMADGAEWLDTVAISDTDREKIAFRNAQDLLGL